MGWWFALAFVMIVVGLTALLGWPILLIAAGIVIWFFAWGALQTRR